MSSIVSHRQSLVLSVSLGNKKADQSKALSCLYLFAYNNYNDSQETQMIPGASNFLLFFPSTFLRCKIIMSVKRQQDNIVFLFSEDFLLTALFQITTLIMVTLIQFLKCSDLVLPVFQKMDVVMCPTSLRMRKPLEHAQELPWALALLHMETETGVFLRLPHQPWFCL